MNLEIYKLPNSEIVHYADSERIITSYANTVSFNLNGKTRNLILPQKRWQDLAKQFRIFRRTLRLDQINVVSIDGNFNEYIILHQGRAYHYDLSSETLTPTLELTQGRNAVHQSIAVIDEKEVFFGEYDGRNPERNAVPIYKSKDRGKSWSKVYEFPKSSIKHIHGCYWDKHEEKIWVFTGDLDGECNVLVTDRDFKEIEFLGDGSQKWRATNAFFEADAVYWGMDSNLEENHFMKLNRKSRTLEMLVGFPGPVIHTKKLDDGVYLASTSCEKGPGVLSDNAHLFASLDAENWEEVGRFKHDGLPKGYFKYGAIRFSYGHQTSQNFFISGEALKDLEGIVAQCKLNF